MQLPKLEFLKEKNIYSGSDGEFRYKLKPDNDTFHVWAYRIYCLDYCMEQGLILGEESFPIDENGLENCKAWLEQKQ